VDSEPEAVVDRLFGIREIFSEGLASSAPFRDAVVSHLAEVRELTSARRSKG
jgi:hypothetical protein